MGKLPDDRCPLSGRFCFQRRVSADRLLFFYFGGGGSRFVVSGLWFGGRPRIEKHASSERHQCAVTAPRLRSSEQMVQSNDPVSQSGRDDPLAAPRMYPPPLNGLFVSLKWLHRVCSSPARLHAGDLRLAFFSLSLFLFLVSWRLRAFFFCFTCVRS